MTSYQFRKLAGLGILLLVLNGCWRNSGSQAYVQVDVTSTGVPPGPHRLSADCEASLRNFLNTAEMPDLHWPNFANYQKEAKEFYDAASRTLPWIDQGKPTSQARAIIHSLKNAADKELPAFVFQVTKRCDVRHIGRRLQRPKSNA